MDAKAFCDWNTCTWVYIIWNFCTSITSAAIINYINYKMFICKYGSSKQNLKQEAQRQQN